MNRQRTDSGFTLVELLVVIGIIALLVGILLPALTAARKAANTVYCSANLRGIAQAMQIYVAQNNGYIPGSPLTSSYHLWGKPEGVHATNNWCPTTSSIYDWQSPIGRIMGMKFNLGGTTTDRLERFKYLMQRPEFHCPENNYVALEISSPTLGFGALPLNSYVQSTLFLLVRQDPVGSLTLWGDADRPGEEGESHCQAAQNNPRGYIPKITKVGKISQKVFMACGAKYSNAANPPGMPTTYQFNWGGAMADRGPFLTANGCWDRSMAPGNGGVLSPSQEDPRNYGFRHGKHGRGNRGDSVFKFNVAFFDGHVETMGDIAGSHPAMWTPKGCDITATRVYKDIRDRFNLPQAGRYVTPY